MSKWVAVGLVVVVLAFIVVLVCAMTVMSIYNREVALRTAIEQKQVDNKSEFDNMWKKISQVAQVTDAQKNALMEIFQGYAKARSGGDNKNLLMTWLQESVPNVDTTTFNNLQNIITGSRDSFTMRQKELLDLKREHDKLLRSFPSNIILGMFGKKPIDVVIVTSTKTDESFKTGKDDDINVFKKQ